MKDKVIPQSRLTAVELVPWLVERVTLWPQVPTKISVPMKTMEVIVPPLDPFDRTHWALAGMATKKAVKKRITWWRFITQLVAEERRDAQTAFVIKLVGQRTAGAGGSSGGERGWTELLAAEQLLFPELQGL